MIFDTIGEFIQGLKDYDKYKEMAKYWKNKYSDYHYLRYEKVKSPLDYNIIGYKNGEAIREIKSRGHFNQEQYSSQNEQLEDKMQFCLDEYTKIKNKIDNIECELKSIDEPLKTILDMRYKQHKKLKEVCKKTDLYLDEAGMYKYITRNLEKYYKTI